ncbi:Fanconi anemia core complex-associated protein 100 [Rhinatrema bivittatum]|uniref:Fanconi anemia core complex-associated protein 100 n=1 Tax=Rhinatrema bivittatum TaxID=194408 RepID=UPI00112A6C68|nr:Fanconi anemia core complex-associated protein 100 [Rhinatrema bivittatum]XP_029455090.1 Fanconi anemia core complex-associated protein 100 [Rhinatrema bivittatum]XP_029455091.1 Fanconi anemia core complex-associated protein 100 [Rhinatrema bivittatum]
MASCLQKVRYLAGFQCPVGGLSVGKPQVLCHQSDVYLSIGSKFLYMYDKEEKLVKAVYEFPGRVWHMELVMPQGQLYILCSNHGIYYISVNQRGRLLKQTDPTAEGGDCSSSVVTIDSDSWILQDTAICTFAVVNGFLVTVSKGQSRWRINVLQNVNSGQEDPKYSQIKQLEFTIFSNPRSDEKMENLSFLPTLCCIFPQGADVSSEIPCGHRMFSVETSLFSPLFGLDATMLDSPVILCGFSDGQVCCVPLKTLGFPTVYHSCPDVKDHILPGMILYHLQQPVVFMGALRTHLGESESGGHQQMAEDMTCDCIVIVGQQGKIVTISLGVKEDVRGPEYKEHHFHGPIVCGFCSASSIYYSTLSDLFTLSKSSSQQNTDNSPEVLPFVSSPVSLNLCSIVALSMSAETTEGDTELLALSAKSRLMACSLRGKASKFQHPRITSAKAGQKIKDLLSGIGSVSERVSLLKNAILQKNRSLTHLNQVINVSCALLSHQDLRQSLSCVVTARWSRLLQQDSLVVSCVLENRTEYCLEQGWTLCVHVSSPPCPLNSDSVTSAAAYSFPIMNLLAKHKMEVSFPLSHERSSRLELPVTVSCMLFYSLKGILGKDITCPWSADSLIPHSSSQILLEKEGICLPLNECVLDVLHCFRLQSDQDPRVPSPVVHNCHLPPDPVEIFLQALLTQSEEALARNEKSVQGLGATYMPRLVASVRVSTELLERGLQELCSGSTLHCAVLQWLLADNTAANTVKAQNLCEVHGMVPDGRDIHLRVTEVSIDNMCAAGAVPAVEIRIESPSLAGLSITHQAVIRRLKMLLSPISCPSDLQLKHLQQLIADHEILLKEVQSVRDHLCLRNESGSSAIAEKLLGLYEQLRNPGLLIL